MEQAYILQVPLVVDVGTGTNWLEAHWFFFGLLFNL
jgi:DNA polymerase I-like protein with 3'-5' exonuclease and polymerase domains